MTEKKILPDIVPAWMRGDKDEKIRVEQSTVAFSRKLLHQLTRAAHLYTRGRHNNSSTGIIRYKMVKDAEGKKVEVPVVHHRAPSKPARRRARAHQRRLALTTMRSLECHMQGKSSNPKWFTS